MFGRFFHEVADRFVSDVALDRRRRWAFVAGNQTPVDADGQSMTLLRRFRTSSTSMTMW
jgi:hypothetical protein